VVALRISIGVGAAAAIGAATVSVLSLLDHDERAVAPIRLATAALPPDYVADPGHETVHVVALDELVGVVERGGDDPDELTVDGVELHLGPTAWVMTSPPRGDFDRDGTNEPLRDELVGLVGRQHRFEAHVRFGGEHADVYFVNGLPYRDLTGPAPWQSSDAVGDERILAAAAAAVGEGARVVDLEAEGGSRVVWEAEVIDREGREYEVLLDAAGEVVDVLMS